jgi:ubiquinol-cytochrome c reductase cytochrome c subunit
MSGDPGRAPAWLVILRVPVLGPLVVIVIALAATPFFDRGASATNGATDAQHIFLRDCATCHGADGKGTQYGPTLEGQGAAGIDFMLTTGRMPLHSSKDPARRRKPAYPPETISALVAYAASLVSGPPIPQIGGGDVAAGGSTYRQQCAACHQAALQGGALLGQEQSPSLVESTPVQIAEAVRSGPGTMPVFGPSAVPDEDLQSLVRYVTALQDPADPGGQSLWHLGPMPEGAVAIGVLGVLIFGLRKIGSKT